MMWEMRVRALARTVHGFSEFIVFAFQFMTGGPSPLRTFIGLLVAAPLVALLITRLWNSPTEGKEIAVFLSVSSLALGAAAAYADSLLVSEPSRECLANATDSRVLEIVNYPEIGWNPARRIFLVSSTDGGVSWRQVLHIGPISQSSGCGMLGVFDDSFFWYWVGWKLAVTHDGGETWTVWEPNDLFPERRCCEERRIGSVEFTDQMSGIMRGSFGFAQADLLISGDGGRTWSVP